MLFFHKGISLLHKGLGVSKLSIPEKYEELLLTAGNELKSILTPERDQDVKLVQKGQLLYRQGLVSKVRLEDDLVLAVVQDVTRVQVELNLNFMQISTCSCPSDDLCRHQLATFFHVYAQVASVSEWVETWRQPIQERKNLQYWGIQKAKDLLKTGGVLKPDYDRWVNNFQESFDTIVRGKNNLKPYLVSDLFQLYARKVKASSPVEQEWRQLYQLVASFHSFQMLLELSTDSNFTEDEISRYFRDLFYELMDDIEETINKLNVHALPFAFDTFIEKLKDDSGILISQNYILDFEPTHLYVLLWTKLFKKKAWHEQALQDFERAFPKSKTLPVMVAGIQQYIMLRNDDAALRIIHVLEDDVTPFMLFWLERLTEGKEWKRMAPFLDAFSNMVKPYIRSLYDHYARMDFTRIAIKTVGAYAMETKKLDVYEKILIQTLPYSYRSYDEFLFDLAWYEKWSDLQAFIGYDINSISTERIRILQKEHPEILLPLYHQSIQQHIEMKNRGNYREAVRQLKKLRTLYKKLKRQDDFEGFMDILLERTKRLRAFQQECERGKLTHA